MYNIIETEKLEDVSEATEGEVEKKNEEEVKEKQSLIEEKQLENVVEGYLSIVVAEGSSIGGKNFFYSFMIIDAFIYDFSFLFCNSFMIFDFR